MSQPDLNQYQQKAVDWRAELAKNTRRTYFVIGSFILIYLALGLLVDLYLYSGTYPSATLSQIFFALITFKILPVATLITGTIAIISIGVTFAFSDKLMLLGTEYHQITPETARDNLEMQIYHVVEEMRVAAAMRYMPKVYLIEADYMNAFASGYSEKSAMVAITRGLAEKLNRAELQAVMAHEISHIRHLDIKLTLTASVLANLMLMVIDVLFYSAMFSGNRREGDSRGRSNQLFLIIMLIRFLLPLITVLLMLYLSRTREYMADSGCVELTRDNAALASALLKIQQDHEANQENYSQAYQNTAHETVRRQAYIFDPSDAGVQTIKSFADALATHPTIEKRLAALGFIKKGK